MTATKFSLGQIVATPGAIEVMDESGQDPAFFLQRHAAGDWGEVCPEDGELNNQALVDGSRLLSAYHTLKGVKIWIITEATDDDGQRAATTILSRTHLECPCCHMIPRVRPMGGCCDNCGTRYCTVLYPRVILSLDVVVLHLLRRLSMTPSLALDLDGCVDDHELFFSKHTGKII